MRSTQVSDLTAALIAGALSGVAGLLVFLVIHHFWIQPIWFILPPGLVLAGVGGLAAGWAYAEIRPGLPPQPWTALGVFVLIGATLAPAIALAHMREPLLDMSTFSLAPGMGGRVAIRLAGDLLLTAALVGALAGWALGHSARAAAATALAGLVFAIGPGHNIPLLGGTPAEGKGLALLVAIVLVSALVLVAGHAWLTRSAT
jgi:hypothetical protein